MVVVASLGMYRLTYRASAHIGNGSLYGWVVAAVL
jgi:hypothetical protein